MANTGVRNGILVELVNVSKAYHVFSSRRERVFGFISGQARVLHPVLRNVSFSLAPSEALGLVGENGAGKTTLLRIVAGITQPDSGTVRVSTPVGALLELGLGFHPDFSGRENAKLYASFLGLPHDEAEERMAQIIEFAELGQAIDQPLRTYSTGMKARLAFAVAAQLDPMVLVVDEALAVGDEAFQRKCLAKMREFLDSGKAVLFCSHAMYQVVAFCKRALWLHDGEVRAYGDAVSVVQEYQDHLRSTRSTAAQPLTRSGLGLSTAEVTLRLDPPGPVEPLGPLRILIDIENPGDAPFHLVVEFSDAARNTLAVLGTSLQGYPPLEPRPHRTVVLDLPSCPFVQGPVDILVHLADEKGIKVFRTAEFSQALKIRRERWDPGLIRLAHHWEFL